MSKGSVVRSETAINFDGSSNKAPLKPLPSNVDWGTTKQISQAPKSEGKANEVVATIELPTRNFKVTNAKATDGDGLDFMNPVTKKWDSCRLSNIDAPEVEHEAYTTKSGKKMKASPAQAGGEEAKNYLASLIANNEVDVNITMSRDNSKQGRNFCQLSIKGKNVNIDMVRNGFARVYDRFVSSEVAAEFYTEQLSAKNKKLGIWKDGEPFDPELFRRHWQKQSDTSKD